MILVVPRNRVLFKSFLFFIFISATIYTSWFPLGQTYHELHRRYFAAMSSSECTPKSNIVYVKTHKTIHSPLLHILIRHGLKHKHRIALPHNKKDFNFPLSFDADSIAPHGGPPYNIICHNMRLDIQAVRSVMRGNTVWVTMLSEPVRMFQALFQNYWSAIPVFQKIKLSQKNSFQRWIERAHEFQYLAATSPFNQLSQNPVYYALGYSRSETGYVQLVVQFLSEFFDLVLIDDYLDESLVLLADLMCWDLSQVVHYVTKEKTKETVLGKKYREKVNEWNNADVVLFKYFNATFWLRVDEYGRQKMADSVRELRYIRGNLTEECSSILSTKNYADDANSQKGTTDEKPTDNKKMKRSTKKEDECRLFTMHEYTLSKVAFKIQSAAVKMQSLNSANL